ncbi:Vacuolar membrane protease [Trichinella spiralis]|uniref:Vacuolar membrane protease n=1 Tax=Trichinella spiralis TaxID=6334 RepID=A0ABR3KAX7_TRISP
MEKQNPCLTNYDCDKQTQCCPNHRCQQCCLNDAMDCAQVEPVVFWTNVDYSLKPMPTWNVTAMIGGTILMIVFAICAAQVYAKKNRIDYNYNQLRKRDKRKSTPAVARPTVYQLHRMRSCSRRSKYNFWQHWKMKINHFNISTETRRNSSLSQRQQAVATVSNNYSIGQNVEKAFHLCSYENVGFENDIYTETFV